MKPFAVMAFGLALAACSEPVGRDESTYAPRTVSLDASALHAALIAERDSLVPSDWQTGEPAPETALSYWYVPPTLEDIETTTECTALDYPGSYDCTLTLRAPNYEADEDERRDVEALYRFEVLANDDGTYSLLHPAVRWAVRDAQ